MKARHGLLLSCLLLCVLAHGGRPEGTPPQSNKTTLDTPSVSDGPNSDAKPPTAKPPAKAAPSPTSPLKGSDDAKQSVTNLLRIALAMHNYAATRGDCFPPPAIYSKEGKPLLSWRVALLPFMDTSGGALFRQFKLDEPWDSPHNKKLLGKMPRDFAALPGGKKAPAGHTFYRVFVGPDTVFSPDPGVSAGKSQPRGVKATNISDGASNTLLVVEAGEAVPWTKPDELVYDPKKPLPRLGGLFPGGFHAIMADGNIYFFRKEIAEATVRALITAPAGRRSTGRRSPRRRRPTSRMSRQCRHPLPKASHERGTGMRAFSDSPGMSSQAGGSMPAPGMWGIVGQPLVG